jgi:hypothetical protein
LDLRQYPQQTSRLHIVVRKALELSDYTAWHLARVVGEVPSGCNLG